MTGVFGYSNWSASRFLMRALDIGIGVADEPIGQEAAVRCAVEDRMVHRVVEEDDVPDRRFDRDGRYLDALDAEGVLGVLGCIGSG